MNAKTLQIFGKYCGLQSADIYFLAGLIDTDGSIHLRKVREHSQFVIRVFGQDIKLLNEINEALHGHGFNPALRLSTKKGEKRKHKGQIIRYNKNYYILELCRKKEVFRILNLLPLRHPEKIARKEIVLDLITNGIVHYKDATKMGKLRAKIKSDVKKYASLAEIEYQNRKTNLV